MQIYVFIHVVHVVFACADVLFVPPTTAVLLIKSFAAPVVFERSEMRCCSHAVEQHKRTSEGQTEKQRVGECKIPDERWRSQQVQDTGGRIEASAV